MTRDEYLAQLRALLTGRTPPEELERILAYYTDYFNEAGPEGEARVIQELGTPAELVGRILGAGRAGDDSPPPPQDFRQGSGLSALWKVLLAICAAPIAIPLILLAVLLILAVLLAAAGVVIGFVLGGAGCIVGGVAAAWSGIAVLFTHGMATTMFFCGIGMLCSGFGLLLIAGGFALAGLFCGALAGAMGRWLRRKEGAV